MRTLYADNDPYCAAWLRALAAEDNIPDGDILCADIQEMHGNDLKKYDQVHLFAGIGGWPYALRLAGWPDDRPVWTGSCPCQPFSGAGKRRGRADERHLWPDFSRLIAKCRPPTIFGEQVAGPLGREWLAGVRADLEHLGYAVGAADLPAACVGAPHIRQRLFWVANATSKRFGKTGKIGSGPEEWTPDGSPISDSDTLYCPDGKMRRIESGAFPLAYGVSNRVGRLRAYGNAIVPQVAATFVRAAMNIDKSAEAEV